MKLTVLGSGSTGNAVLIVAGDTRVLVDAGLSAKEIAQESMQIAGKICIFTNESISIEEL